MTISRRDFTLALAGAAPLNSATGGSAADPTTGMLYVRAANQPGFHTLRETGANRTPFAEHCQGCPRRPRAPQRALSRR
jgi:hypothetical protein